MKYSHCTQLSIAFIIYSAHARASECLQCTGLLHGGGWGWAWGSRMGRGGSEKSGGARGGRGRWTWGGGGARGGAWRSGSGGSGAQGGRFGALGSGSGASGWLRRGGAVGSVGARGECAVRGGGGSAAVCGTGPHRSSRAHQEVSAGPGGPRLVPPGSGGGGGGRSPDLHGSAT